MRRSLSSLVAASLLLAPPSRASSQEAPQPPGAIWVRVLGPDSLPMPDAEVVLPTLGIALRVPEGGAILVTGVPEGLYLLQGRRVGYAPAWQTLRVGRDTAIAQLALGGAGQLLDTVTVTDVAPIARRLMDFERRRRTSGFGKYLTQEDVERTRAVDMAALLRHVNGIDVRTGPSGASATSRRTPAHSTCSGMLVFLDGVLVAGQQSSGAIRLPTPTASSGAGYTTPPATPPQTSTPPSSTTGGSAGTGGTPGSGGTGGTTPPPAQPRGPRRTVAGDAVVERREPQWESLSRAPAAGRAPGFDLNAVPLRLVAGIEVYTSGAGIPAEYAGYRGAECGVILIWTAG